MKISLKTIAEALGVSKATVSWILSGKGEEKGFSEATIKLVTEYADKIGYRPNLLARSLSTGSSKILALIIPIISDTFYAQMIEAVEAQSQKHGYTLIVSSSERDVEKEMQIVSTFMAHQVDGIIVAPASTDASVAWNKVLSKIPVVFIDRYVSSVDCNYVTVDNFNCSHELVGLIAAQGAKKIAIVTSDTELTGMRQRKEGYQTMLQERGLEQSESLVVELERASYAKDMADKLDSLFAAHPDCDGIFFTTHYIALEAIRYFAQRRIDYNSRFVMGCFHTTAALDILAPNMILSVMPIEQMGERAVDIVVENIATPNIDRKVALSNTISCARSL